MSARGVTGDVDAVRVATETLGIPIDPTDRASNLVGHGHEAPAGILDPDEIGNHEMRARVDEELGRVGGILGETQAPRAAVDEDVDRCVGPLGYVDIEPFD